jgi:HEAT repeat protein
MTITRLASLVTLASALASPVAAQPAPRPPQPPQAPRAARPPQPPLPPRVDLSHIELPDLSQIELPDLSQLQLDLADLRLDLADIQLPNLSDIQLDLLNLQVPMPLMDGTFAWQGPKPAPFVYADGGQGGSRGQTQSQLDNLYDQARGQIENNQYDRAIATLDRVINAGANQAPGAMYWKAYSLNRTSRRPEALATLAALQKQFPKSPWVKDAQGLELELKQASGQSVSADDQSSDDLKLLALRGLMQTEPESAMPVIEKMLAGGSSVRVKDRALYVVSQSRSARGRALIIGVAKGNNNPDLQLRAIRYIGQMGGPESAQTLDEVYRATGDERVKREIIRALGNANAKGSLLSLAKGESSAELRGDAVRALGNMNATTELEQLYKGEQSTDVKKRILQGLHNGNASDKLAAIARAESDPELKRSAIQNLGNMRGAAATDTLRSIYASETSEDIKMSIIRALGGHDSAAALVSLARAEKSPKLKEEIVRRLGNMRDPVATAYLLEILK